MLPEGIVLRSAILPSPYCVTADHPQRAGQQLQCLGKAEGGLHDVLGVVDHARVGDELAQLLISLEAVVKQIQTGLDVAERPPWRTDASAHEHIGAYARRFFEGFGASDGRIVGYLPPEGEDGALWHMVHGDDKDEEDLDEHEVAFAMSNYRDDLKAMGGEERAYIAAYEARQAAKPAGEGEEPPERQARRREGVAGHDRRAQRPNRQDEEGGGDDVLEVQ